MMSKLGFLPLLVLAAALLAGCESDSSSPDPIDPCDLGASATIADEGRPGVLYTWAGSGAPGYDGGGRPLLESRFSQPADMYWTSGGVAYIVDFNNHCIRKLEADGTLRTVIGEPGFPGDGPGVFYPDENDAVAPVPGLHSLQNHPTDLAELPDGRLLFAAWHNHKVRLFDPATEMVSVLCGGPPGYVGDGSAHTSGVRFKQVEQVLLYGSDLYILDQVNLRVRKITDFVNGAGVINPDAIITTVVGTGNEARTYDASQEGAPPTSANLNFVLSDNPPMQGAIAFDDQGRLYVTDTRNHTVRRADFEANTIHTVVGVPGQPGYDGDGGPATQAHLNFPIDIEFGPDGRLYIADEFNHAVRVFDPGTGVIETLAGRGETVVSECDVATSKEIGDGGPATEAYLHYPRGLAFDAQGRLYITDTFHYRIRRMVLPN